MAFSVLICMANAWGGSESANASQHAIPGFNQFMFTRFSPLSWTLPSSSGFNPKDGQTRQVLQEAGGLQYSIYSKAGTEYVEYLRGQELPGMGMGPDLVVEYLNALTQSDLKGFRNFFLVSFPFRFGQVVADNQTVFYPAPQLLKARNVAKQKVTPYFFWMNFGKETFMFILDSHVSF